MSSGITSVLLTAIVASACVSASGARVSSTDNADTDGQTYQAAIAKAREDSARRPYTAADLHFMSGMIGHHSQAMVMSKLAPARGASASVLRLAERILNGQADEVATMQHWLLDRRQPVHLARPEQMKMTMAGVEHEMEMPGMLTETQIRRLELARGPEFDRLFLTFMIQHHRGAVAMVTSLFASYGAGQDQTVFKLASDVSAEQTTEIARMQKMLAEITLGVPIQ